MQLDIVVAFFLMGALAQLIRAPIKLPEGLYQTLTLLLLVAIGLKGGIALAEHAGPQLLLQSVVVVLLGLCLPLIAFPILYRVGRLSRVDAASIAAHYGSVSVATFAVALAVLEASNIDYEPYFPLFVALLEVPAIIVGLWLAQASGEAQKRRTLLRETFLNQGILLLVGSLVIGWLAAAQSDKVMPLFGDLFYAVLALFLLEMGRVAASKLSLLKRYGAFITSFAVFMPLVGALLGGLAGWLMNLSAGGAVLLATLGASASYIAVPAAMSVALPSANQNLSITASLGVTFPFNVLVGIPLYLNVITALS